MFLGIKIDSNKSKLIIVVIINFVTLLAGVLANIFAADVHETIKEAKPDEIKPQRVIVPPIEIKNYIQSTPEPKQAEVILPSSSKFYPNSFIPDLKFFVGRKLLMEKLEKTLKAKHRASIHDISGLGKTFSTYKFADKHREKYDKIFFVRANRETMLQSLAEIGVILNPLLENEPEQAKKAFGFTKWLEENEKWLIIYDNVDVPNELKPYIPANLKGDCLFTSNFPAIEHLAESVSIGKLSETEAKQLLYSRANNKPQTKFRLSDEEQIAFEKIIEEVDGHPLSLNTTGAFISRNIISFAEYQRKMEKTPEILLENDDEFDNYHRRTALKAFSIAIDDIRQPKPSDRFKNSAELAEKLLFAVSFIAPDDIPEILLQKVLTETAKPKTLLQKILSGFAKIDFESEKHEDLWLEIRGKLLTYDLLKYDKNAKNFTTHRLIQKVIQTKRNEPEKTAICKVGLTAIDELFPFSKHETKKECEIYFSHAVAIIEKAEDNNLASEEIASICDKIGRHLRETVKYQESVAYFEKAIVFYRNLPKNKNNLATSLNELALVYNSQGRYDETIKNYQEALLIMEQIIGKEHLDYIACLSNLANVYQSQGRYDEAIEKYEEALQIDEHTLSKEHSDYAILLGNLASVYRSQGRYDEAIEKYEEALQIGERTIGKEHPNYATRLNNLASVYRSQGKYDEAIKKFEEALRIDERTIGKKHPDYAIRLNNLASVYHSQGRYDEAIEKLQEALRINEQTIGKEHPVYATRLNNLALVYQSQGKYDEAIDKLQEALQINEQTISKKHPNYASGLNNLALVYQSQNKCSEAIETYQEVLQIDERTIGKEHPDYAIHLNNLASVYESQKKIVEALNLYRKALKIFKNTLPENHPYTKQLQESVEKCEEIIKNQKKY